jgi:prepilin-type processing-associated H-X9-DG protein
MFSSGDSIDLHTSNGASRGMFGINTAGNAPQGFRLADVTDGLSNTLAMSERIRGDSNLHITQTLTNGGSWFTTPNGCLSQFNPSTQLWTGAGSRGAWAGVRWPDGGMGFGGLTTNAPPNSVSCAWNSHDAQPGLYPPSSRHSGGVNAVMGDGSVRFITNSINAGSPNNSGIGLSGPSPFGVFGAMGTRRGGEAVAN